MITLTHTGMRVPSARVRVTSLKQFPVGCGIAWTAVLRLDAAKLGVIEDDGQGGDPQFLAVNDKAERAVAHFVSLCRDHQGRPVDKIAALNALTDEYELTRIITKNERHRAYIVRYHDRHDIPNLLMFTLKRSAPPDYEPARKIAHHLDLPKEAVRAELWMGDDRGWAEFFRTDPAPE